MGGILPDFHDVVFPADPFGHLADNFGGSVAFAVVDDQAEFVDGIGGFILDEVLDHGLHEPGGFSAPGGSDDEGVLAEIAGIHAYAAGVGFVALEVDDGLRAIQSGVFRIWDKLAHGIDGYGDFPEVYAEKTRLLVRRERSRVADTNAQIVGGWGLTTKSTKSTEGKREGSEKDEL